MRTETRKVGPGGRRTGWRVRTGKRFTRVPNPELVKEVADAMARPTIFRRANRWDANAEGSCCPRIGQTWELTWKNVVTGRKMRRWWFVQQVARWGKGHRLTLRLAGGTGRPVAMPFPLRNQYDHLTQTLTVGATELRNDAHKLGRCRWWRRVKG